MAVASLVLGIVALVFTFIPGLNLVSIILGVVGIILGVVGSSNPSKRGMATAGVVMSIIAVALGLLFWIACASCLGTAGCAGLM